MPKHSKFVDPTLSTQVIADNQNPFGTYRGDDNDTWIGTPLLLHRRCLNPMFDISNEIAYDNKMFHCTIDNSKEKTLSLKESVWFDIQGKSQSKENHYIKEQGQKVIELLRNALEANGNNLPALFIITPFRDVTSELKIEIKKLLKSYPNLTDKDIRNWLKKSCGTVHTFQGKETNEVILVLGCDISQMGAVNWASRTPNILNVAVTRAKYRIAIIGNAQVWSKANYFNVAYRKLKHK